LRKAILKTVKDKVREKLEFYIDWGTNIYSLRKVSDIPTCETEHDGTKYKVMIDWV